MSNKSVTFQLNSTNYQKPEFKEGAKIKLGRSSWRLSRQRIKNKQMVHRLLKKEYYPYMIVKNVASDIGSVTLTLKPYNF
jgi:hypothetical protein